MAEAQGEKIGNQSRVHGRRDRGISRRLGVLQQSDEYLFPGLEITENAGPRGLGLCEPIRRQRGFATTGENDQALGSQTGRRFSAVPSRCFSGPRYECRMVQCGPPGKQFLGFGRTSLKGEAFKARAGEQHDQIFIYHTLYDNGWDARGRGDGYDRRACARRFLVACVIGRLPWRKGRRYLPRRGRGYLGRRGRGYLGRHALHHRRGSTCLRTTGRVIVTGRRIAHRLGGRFTPSAARRAQ